MPDKLHLVETTSEIEDFAEQFMRAEVVTYNVETIGFTIVELFSTAGILKFQVTNSIYFALRKARECRH